MGEVRGKVAILGATGRMGQALLAALQDSTDLELCGALVSPGNELIGRDAGADLDWRSGIAYSDDLAEVLAHAKVAIDVTLPTVTNDIIAACRKAACPLVIGTTGLSDEQRQALTEAANSIAVLPATNFSIAMTLMAGMVREACARLGPAWRVDILETHHQQKIDRPSGTALALAEEIAAARGQRLAEVVEYVDAPEDRNNPDSIAIQSVRTGTVAGEHTVTFSDGSETLELVHRAGSRAAFAGGALKAAAWLARQSPGFYRMEQVTGS
ncbi:MAG: 4-hydroxy-tetrahydrodipicolinate reductase [Gammaproteobacteria bacterium]|nr:4-hydroxy-tetrahydrodipicolinate reductase [Gammaproteobacteria bacterium]